MLYTLKQVPVEQGVIKACLREGIPLPDRILNAPVLFMGSELFYNAFWDLTTDRPGGMGLLPIPWYAIQRYAEYFEFSQEQSSDLHYFVRVMDAEYVKFQTPKGGKSSLHQGRSGSSQNAWT